MKTTCMLSTLLALGLAGLACAGNQRPQELRRTGPAPLHLPWAVAGLTRREAAAHLLNRFSYGPRPGEVAAVAAMGPERWLERQLAGNLPEPALAGRLAGYPALSMTVGESLCAYPNDGAVRNEAKKAGVIPGDKDKKTENAAMSVLPGEEREKEIRAVSDHPSPALVDRLAGVYRGERGRHPPRRAGDRRVARILEPRGARRQGQVPLRARRLGGPHSGG